MEISEYPLEEYNPTPYVGHRASIVKTRAWDKVKKALLPLGLQDSFYLSWGRGSLHGKWDAVITGLQRPATCSCDPWNVEDCLPCKETIGQVANQVRQVLHATFPRKKAWSWGCECHLNTRPGITPRRFEEVNLYPLYALNQKMGHPEKEGQLFTYLKKLPSSITNRVVQEACVLCEKRQNHNGHCLPYGKLPDCYLDCPIALIWRKLVKEAWT